MTNNVTIMLSDVPRFDMTRIETEINGFADPRVPLIEKTGFRKLRWDFETLEIRLVSAPDSITFQVLEKPAVAVRDVARKAA